MKRDSRYSHKTGDIAKRVIDVLVALPTLILLLPVFVVIALGIKRDSPGPVFFAGKRAASGGGTFSLFKFRTMYERQSSYDGPAVTAHNDQRITPFGRWLRHTKLNELPQLWNVVVGDMSLVGPRPEDPEIASTWPESVRAEIQSVRPGITSPASVLYRNEEALLTSGSVMNTYFDQIVPNKLRLDQLYVRHRSIWLDLDVIFWTLVVLMPRLEDFRPPEHHIYWGPVSRLMRRYVNWFCVDVVLTCVAFGLVGFLFRADWVADGRWLPAALIPLAFVTLFNIAGAILGANRIDWSKSSAGDALDLAPGIALATLVSVVANHLSGVYPAHVLLTSCAVACAGYITCRYRRRLLTGLARRICSFRTKALAAHERVLIVGSGEAGQFAAWMLTTASGLNRHNVVGFVDDDLTKNKLRIRGVRVLGSVDDVPALVQTYDVGIIVFAIHNVDDDNRERLLSICHGTAALVVTVPDFVGSLSHVRENHEQMGTSPVSVNEDNTTCLSSGNSKTWL